MKTQRPAELPVRSPIIQTLERQPGPHAITHYLLCCDWGTSFFRLQLMDMETYHCIHEIHSPIGVAGTFDKWREAGETEGRELFFRRLLREQIERLAAAVSADLINVPVVISGMASSSIGMAQVPYATLPFSVEGHQAGVRHFDAQPDFPHDMLLVSGVRSEDDVMRGEETQLIGLIALLDLSGHHLTDAVCIFPGTHSKHLRLKNRALVQFDTYMTGEIFDLMTKQSILKDSVAINRLSDFSSVTIRAFQEGVRQSVSSFFLKDLFKIRTNQLFDKLTKAENTFYLSGLLIGHELNHLIDTPDQALVLCCGSNLLRFYELAVEALNLTDRTITIPTEVMERAASVGQIRLFAHQFVKQSAE